MKKTLLILALLALVPARGSATELIVNGGFETGDLTGWTTTGIVDIGTANYWDTDPYSGTYMAVLSPYGFLDAGVGQDIDFTGYSNATVSFAYSLGALDWSPIVDAGTDKLQVFLGGHLILEDPIDARFATIAVTPWTPVSYVVPTEWLDGELRFIFYSENGGPGGGDELQNMVAYIDDVSVTASVPDLSSSLLLLGMGLTGLAGAARLRLQK